MTKRFQVCNSVIGAYCVFLVLKVGVHIADVSHFIRPGNALDREAASRGTTVYLVDKVTLATNMSH